MNDESPVIDKTGIKEPLIDETGIGETGIGETGLVTLAKDDGAKPAGAIELRAAVLSGLFVGSPDPALAGALAGFLAASHEDALTYWLPRGAGDPRGLLDRDIVAIDAMLSEQLDAILHNDRLRQLEGRWRGLAWLVHGMDQGSRLKAKIFNVTWPEICRDLERAVEFDQSHLFRKIYEDEFGTPGGEPYGLMIVDHDIRHRSAPTARTDDVSALASLASVAAAAFCPTIVGTSPALLEVDDFADLATVTEIASPLRNADHARWRNLTSRVDTRFIGVILPRLLARPPWRDDGTRDDGFHYAEYAPEARDRVWMSAGFAYARVVARAFAASAWPGDTRGADLDRLGGGLVDDMPAEPFDTDPDHVWVRKPVEIIWNDRQERELLDAGFIPLASVPHCDELVFGAARSPLVPQRFTGPNADAANSNARLSNQLNTIMCASRFAHYIKMLGRQMVGSYKTSDEIEAALDDWLKQFVRSNAPYETRARYPLIAGKVTVHELSGKPGSFGCTVFLQPHYQIDDVAASFQLVTDLGGR